MENNFKCLCGYEFYEPSYSIAIRGEITCYLVKGKPMSCPRCKATGILAIPKEGDYTTTTFGKFSSAGQDEKKRMLRNRATAHKKKTEEQYKTIDREFKGITNPKHY